MNDEKEFELWAFGPGPFATAIDRMNAWNERHGDNLKLKESDLIRDSIQAMWSIYQPKNETSNKETAIAPRQSIRSRIRAFGRKALVQLQNAWLSSIPWIKDLWI